MASKNIIAVLKEAGCEGADLTKAAQTFSNEDVAELEDLGDIRDRDKVSTKTGEILAKTGLPQDKIDKLKQAIIAAWENEKASPPPAEPPPAKAPSSGSIKAVIDNFQATDDEKKRLVAAFDKAGLLELVNLGKDEP